MDVTKVLNAVIVSEVIVLPVAVVVEPAVVVPVGYDKLYKVRPIIDSILQKCLSLYKPHWENSICEEATVSFKGRSLLKQYVPSKPTKCGYKVWIRCDSRNGFTCADKMLGLGW